MIRYLVLYVLLGLISLGDIKANPIHLASHAGNKCWLQNNYEIYTDSSNQKTIEQIILAHHNKNFTPATLNGNTIEPHYTYWICFELNNHKPEELQWMLHLNTQVSHMWLYPFVATRQGLQPLSTDSSISVIYISDNRILLPVQCNVRNIYYVKLQNHLAVPTDLSKIYLTPSSGYRHYYLTHGLFVGLVLGGLFVMMLYGFISFMRDPKSVFLYYFLYTLFIWLYLIIVSFIGEQYIFRNNPWFCFKGNVLLLIAFVFYFPFVRNMTVHERNLHIDRWVFKPFIIFMVTASSVISVIAFINDNLFKQLFDYALLIYSVYAIILIIVLWRSNLRLGRIILTGMGCMVTGGFLSITFGLLDNIEENHFFNLGVFAELLIFTYAINQLQKEAELRITNSKQKLDNQHRELTQKALHIAQQEEILLKIKDQLMNIKGERSQTNELILNTISDVDLYLKQTSWSDFEVYFTEVHPEFYRSIKNSYPGLSQHELRVCALIKLNLNTKQIADITRKSPKSIEVTRSRIRQKLDLSRDENLFDKLSQF